MGTLRCAAIRALCCWLTSWLFLSSLALGQTEHTANDAVQTLAELENTRAAASRIQNAISSLDDEELLEALASEDSGLSLAAGWERVLRSMPVPASPQLVAIDQLSVERFLGLAEGRLEVRIPAAWETGLLNVQLNYQGHTTFPTPGANPPPGEVTVPDIDTTVERETELPEPTVRHEGQHWLVRRGDKQWLIPSENVRGVRRRTLGVRAVVLEEENASYVVLYTGWPPTGCDLCALNNEGELMWVSQVCGAGGLFNYSGQGWHDIAIASGEHEVVIFGISGGTAYIEAFEKQTGQAVTRFCTSVVEVARRSFIAENP